MIIVLVIFLILVFAFYYSYIDVHGSYNFRRKKYIVIVVLLLILQSGLRKMTVGINLDTQVYYNHFENIKNISWSDLFEYFVNQIATDPFYFIFQKGFQIFSNSFQLYLIFVAVIFMTAMGSFIYKNTTQIRHAVVAFVFYMAYFYGFFSLTGTRQVLATAFLLWSFEFVKKRKLFYFVLFIVIAGLFHVTALVFLPFYYIGKIKKANIIIGLAVLSFPIIFYLKKDLVDILVRVSGMEHRFGYLTEQYHHGGSLILTLFSYLLGFFGLIIYKNVITVNKIAYRLYNMYALALFFYPLQWLNPTLGRISLYYSIVMIVWIPFLLDAIAGNILVYRQIVYTCAILLFISLTIFTIGNGNQYLFYWE